jgi:hypothetical protein
MGIGIKLETFSSNTLPGKFRILGERAGCPVFTRNLSWF